MTSIVLTIEDLCNLPQTAQYLFIRLLFMADDNGNVDISEVELSNITGISYQTVRTSLKKLLLTSKVTSKVTSKGKHISIYNIGKYKKNANGANELANEQTNEQKEKETEKEKVTPLTTPFIKEKDKEKESHPDKEKETITKVIVIQKEIPPNLMDVLNYFSARGSTAEEANRFWNFYESNGWMVGKNKMQKWKASASNWISKNKKTSNSHGFDFNGTRQYLATEYAARLEQERNGQGFPDVPPI